MRKFSKASAARLLRAASLAVACAILSAPALADSPAPGADTLANARAAWDKGEFDAAEVLFKSALDQGGLAPKDTLDAYIHLGTARAVQGKRDLARAAFRHAAFIDRHFAVPGEGGKRALAIASLARRDEAKVGSIRLTAKIPEGVPANAPFRVEVTLDGKHAAQIARYGLAARDPASGKHWESTISASVKAHFEVPAEVALPGAALVVRVDALDAHDNRLVSREENVKVAGETASPPVPAAPEPIAVSAPSYTLPTLSIALGEENALPPEHTEHTKSGGGFWSSPWTYIVGGVVLAGAGAAIFYETRPSADVSLGAPSVVTR